MSVRPRLVPTAELPPECLDALRGLFDDAFAGRFDVHDFAHALGGVHAIVCEEGRPIAHGSVVPRTLWHGDRALRCGYVEGVAVATDRQRRGLGNAVMAALEPIVRRRYELGALGASPAGAPVYRSRGWLPWRGTTWTRAPGGRTRAAADDDHVFVLVGSGLDLDLEGELDCDWRAGDVW